VRVSDDQCNADRYTDCYRNGNGHRNADRYADAHADSNGHVDSVMPTLRARYDFAMTTGANVRSFASPFVAPLLTLTQDPVSYQVAVPPSSIVTVWDEDAGGANPDAFTFLLLHTDIEVEIEKKDEAGVNSVLSTFTLAADHIPFVLGSNKARAAASFAGDALANGTVGRTTKLRAKNSSTDTTAYIEIVIGK